MSQPTGSNVEGGARAASLFECDLCGARRATRAIRYTRLGYAVCPVCEFPHGP